MGIILGIAVLLDALLVRLMLVPILLRLSGAMPFGRRTYEDFYQRRRHGSTDG